jgi:hypothetical protein
MINMRNALTQLYPVRRHGSAGGRHAEGTTETCHDLVTQHLILLLENLADRRRSFSFGCVAMRHAMAAGSAQRHLVRGAQVRCPCRGAKGTRTPDLLVANETRYQLRHSPADRGGPISTETLPPSGGGHLARFAACVGGS